ncbi:hypothetical protein CR513_43874, partial [Mucuna pruriens]
MIRIDTSLDRKSEKHLIRFITENWDVFEWTPTNMLGIDLNFFCHRLSINSGTWLVAQKKNSWGKKNERQRRRKPTSYWQLYSTWLANVFKVKMSNDKWRMCINYTDLNKACP